MAISLLVISKIQSHHKRSLGKQNTWRQGLRLFSAAVIFYVATSSRASATPPRELSVPKFPSYTLNLDQFSTETQKKIHAQSQLSDKLTEEGVALLRESGDTYLNLI